ncbi:cytochrome P450, partial [Xylophilus sp. Kf1]|nr:cytochrome P450 [Xylophilus sp. Kf1]
MFDAFRDHQAAQPLVNLAALLPLPAWMPRPHSRRTRATAARIRGLIGNLVRARRGAIAAGTAPDDLATRIMTTPDPDTGTPFSEAEMIDQV